MKHKFMRSWLYASIVKSIKNERLQTDTQLKTIPPLSYASSSSSSSRSSSSSKGQNNF